MMSNLHGGRTAWPARARKTARARDRDLDRLMPRSADRDADPVHERPDAFLANISRKIAISGGYEITRERARDVFRRGGIRRTAGRRVPAACGKAGFDVAIARGMAAAVWIRVLRSETGISMTSDGLALPAKRRGGFGHGGNRRRAGCRLPSRPRQCLMEPRRCVIPANAGIRESWRGQVYQIAAGSFPQPSCVLRPLDARFPRA